MYSFIVFEGVAQLKLLLTTIWAAEVISTIICIICLPFTGIQTLCN